jgi:hypothetical protein
MDETWMGIVVGSFALLIAVFSVAQHYRREHMRSRLLRHLDHYSWYNYKRSRR